MTDLKVVQLKPKEEKLEPVKELIDALEDLIQMAKEGDLRSFIGCGFDSSGGRVDSMSGEIWENVWAMKGSLYELMLEYDLTLTDE